MYCSNCGKKLYDTNQKFCHNCGTKVLTTFKTTDYKTERLQTIPKPEIYYVPIKKQMPLQKGLPGKYSKLCFWLALVSVFIGIVTLIIGYNYFRIFYLPYIYIKFIVRLVLIIVNFILRVGGLAMGILSKTIGTKAELEEPYNDLEKAGSIFGILGILINSLGLVMSFLIPWSLFSVIPIPID